MSNSVLLYSSYSILQECPQQPWQRRPPRRLLHRQPRPAAAPNQPPWERSGQQRAAAKVRTKGVMLRLFKTEAAILEFQNNWHQVPSEHSLLQCHSRQRHQPRHCSRADKSCCCCCGGAGVVLNNSSIFTRPQALFHLQQQPRGQPEGPPSAAAAAFPPELPWPVHLHGLHHHRRQPACQCERPRGQPAQQQRGNIARRVEAGDKRKQDSRGAGG